MTATGLRLLLGFIGAAVIAAAPAAADPDGSLRVCADPNNLPFSNQRLEGFENKLAELVATEFGVTPQYTWMPQRRGFIRRTLNARTCDVVMGVPSGYEPVLTTRPYYRSTYVFAYAKARVLSCDHSTIRYCVSSGLGFRRSSTKAPIRHRHTHSHVAASCRTSSAS